jgi:hypothetical protein
VASVSFEIFAFDDGLLHRRPVTCIQTPPHSSLRGGAE